MKNYDLIKNHIGKLNAFFLNRIIKIVLVQGNHRNRIVALFKEINEQSRSAFTEDNDITHAAFLEECFNESISSSPSFTFTEQTGNSSFK